MKREFAGPHSSTSLRAGTLAGMGAYESARCAPTLDFARMRERAIISAVDAFTPILAFDRRDRWVQRVLGNLFLSSGPLLPIPIEGRFVRRISPIVCYCEMYFTIILESDKVCREELVPG